MITSLDNTMDGTYIDHKWVVMFPRDQKVVHETKYNLTGTGLVKNILLGCKPDSDFAVYNNGRLHDVLTSSNQGVLSFSMSLDSEHTLRITNVSSDSDQDGDVDGVDLSSFATQFNEKKLSSFAGEFGISSK